MCKKLFTFFLGISIFFSAFHLHGGHKKNIAKYGSLVGATLLSFVGAGCAYGACKIIKKIKEKIKNAGNCLIIGRGQEDVCPVCGSAALVDMPIAIGSLALSAVCTLCSGAGFLYYLSK